jgi:phytoene dehydrogenase-like protein
VNTSSGPSSGTESTDVVIVGGGHNALVAAAYLARAGVPTVVLERLGHTGGAAISAEAFTGLPARLSRYSYLVSLMPQQIIDELGLSLELRSRTTASYTPLRRDGRDTALLVERTEGAPTRQSFLDVTGSEREYAAWQQFYAELADFAHVVLPSVLGPLPTAAAVRDRSPASIWHDVVERPIGDAIGDRFSDDDVAGVIGTDALIGTFNSLHDPSLVQNRCFLYHLIGNGTGEWRVPVGGMGAVTDALAASARAAGAELRTGCEVSAIDAGDEGCEVRYVQGGVERVIAAGHVLSGVAPEVLDRLRGRTPTPTTLGAQLKINLLLERLPRLKSGVDPKIAWAGTFHLDEGHAQLEHAYEQAAAGTLPPASGEFYCHSLTDPSILGPELAEKGWHTLTYFGLHTPPAVFADDPVGLRDEGVERALDALDAHLVEPVRDCVATDADGRPCIEAKTPLDLEAALHMPGGHIFHGDLQWPWLDDGTEPASPAEAWGVATPDARVLLCGAGAQRGGAVSGIGGHNAAHALLEQLRG